MATGIRFPGMTASTGLWPSTAYKSVESGEWNFLNDSDGVTAFTDRPKPPVTHPLCRPLTTKEILQRHGAWAGRR